MKEETRNINNFIFSGVFCDDKLLVSILNVFCIIDTADNYVLKYNRYSI